MATINPPTTLRASVVLRDQAQSQNFQEGNKMELKQGWFSVSSTVSKTEEQANGKGKRVAVGTYDAAFPTASIVASAFTPESMTVTGKDDAGFPIYASDVVNEIMGSIWAKIDQRNKSYLVPGTVQIMAGKSLVADLSDLVSDGSGKGEGAKRRAECITALCAYIVAQGRKEDVVQRIWAPIFSSPKSLATATAKYKEAALQYVSGFMSQLSAENMVRYASTLTSIEQYASQQEEDEI